MPGVQSPDPDAGLAAALPAQWARALAGWVSRRAGLFTQEGSSSPGRGPEADDSPAGLPRAVRRVAPAVRKPPTGPSPAARHLGVPRGCLPPSDNGPGPCASETPRAAPCATKFLCTASGTAYLGAGARARRARGGRRTGARGPAAWWGARLSCGAGGGLRGGVRPGRGGGGPGAAALREAGAAALARAPPPPSLPQRLPPSPGAAAAPAPRPGRPGCRRSGRSRRAALCREDSGSGTHRGLRLPRAPVHCARCLRPFPFLPPSSPRGSTFLLSLLLPFSPRPGPRPAATRSVYGEAGRAELRPSRGPAGKGGRGHPGGSCFRRTWRPGQGSKSWGSVWPGFPSSWGLREGGGARCTGEPRLYLGLLDLRRESGSAAGSGESCRGSLVLPKPRSPEGRSTGECYREATRSVGE